MLKEKLIKICGHIIEANILAIIFLVPVYFSFLKETYNTFELNKLVVFRVLLALAIVFYAAKIFLEGKINYFAKPKFFLLAVLIIAAFAASTVLSIHPQLSLWGNYERQQGFYSLINYLLFFILLLFHLRSWQQARRIIATIISASALVCFYGFLQHFNIDSLSWKEAALYTGRIFSTLGQPNFLGQYLIMVLPLTVFAAIFIFKRLISRFLAIILIAAQLACLIFTYSRAAWLAVLASLLTFILTYLYVKNYKRLLAGFLAFCFVAGSLIIILNISPKQNPNETVNIFSRAKSIFDLKSGSNKIRFFYWQSAWSELKSASWQRKMFGYGGETEASIFVKYYRPEWGVYETINSFPDRAHNVIFDMLLQFGLVGLTAVGLFYFFIIREAVKFIRLSEKFFPVIPAKAGIQNSSDISPSWIPESSPRMTEDEPGMTEKYWLLIFLLASLAGYFVNNLFSFSLTVGYVYVFVILAMALFIVNGEIKRKVNLNRLSYISRLLIWLALAGASGVFVYYYNILPFAADYYYMRAKKAEAADCRRVLDYIDKAINLNSVSDIYKKRYIYHGLNCFSAVGSKEDQNALYGNIISRANSIGWREYEFATLINMAHAKSLFAFYINPVFYAAAEKDYARIIGINPWLTVGYRDLARLQLWQGDYDGAIANLKKAIEIVPPLDHPYLNSDHRDEIKKELVNLYESLGFSYAHKEEWQTALSYYHEVLRIDPRYLPLYKSVADVYYSQRDFDKAIWYNKRGAAFNPADYKWPLAIAILYKERGDKEAAVEYAASALVLAPENKQIKDFITQIK
ncbi:O-antigen ligase family protein [Candidatus Falkowbacteria bacterium]|nr:O-antigen ligase family protein [Candidatus Falkowbacteria bacterium]